MKKKSDTVKKRVGKSVYIGKYEHLFNQRWTDNEIMALADEMYDWFQIDENMWLKDFTTSKMFSVQRINEFVKKNKYFSQIYDICIEIQESKLVKIGLDKKFNVGMAIIALKHNHGWKDYTEMKIQDMPEIKFGIIPNRTTAPDNN